MLMGAEWFETSLFISFIDPLIFFFSANLIVPFFFFFLSFWH